jgi:hypothetical protein
VVTLSFIVSSIALFLGIFWYDACQFLDVVTDDFGTYIPVKAAATGLQACFEGTSLLVAFNLSKQLSFADNLGANFAQVSGFNVSGVRPMNHANHHARKG